MKYEAIGDYATAARFLQLPPGENLAAAHQGNFGPYTRTSRAAINLISDDPNGSVEAGLPLGQERVGVLTVGGTTADLILVRVDDPVAGKIWLVSRAVAGEYSQALRPAGERKANGGQSNQACSTKRPSDPGDVVDAMARLAALDSARVVTGLAVDFSAERAAASLVQAPQTSFQDSLGYTSWHAAQVHDCDPAAWLFRVPAAAAAFVSRLLCSFPGSPPGGMFRLAR